MGGGRGGSTKNLTSSSNNNNGGGGIGVGSGSGTGLGSIPAGSRKIVQSLKEIVNCPEVEIYAMLKECNMDPNETVNRLLAQGTFHEVKSKREKKKEIKETSDFRPRATGGTSNRGRAGADRYAGRGSSQYSASDSGSVHARPAYKKDNGSVYHVNSLSSAPAVGGHNTNWGPQSYSQVTLSEDKWQTQSQVTVSEDKFPALGMADNSSSISQPPSGYQSAWVGAPGQVSMSDIVKMGKPINKAASSFHNANQGQGHGQGQQFMSNNWGESEDHTSKGSMENFDLGVHSVEDEWPLMEPPLPPTTLPPVSEVPVDHGLHVETSNLSSDTSNSQSMREETQQVEDSPVEDHGANDALSSSFSDRQIQEDTSGDAAIYENELYPNRVSYQPQHGVEHEEVANVGIPVASVTANLQKLNIQKEDRGLPSERVAPSVVIPDHLQAQSVDCSHLSFGSFRSGLSPVFPGPSASMPVRTNSEETSGEVGVSSVGQSDNRESEYYMEESLRNEPDAKIYHGTGTATYESNAPQPEQLKVENPELGHGSQYAFTSTPGYAYENPQQLNTGYSQSQTASQMQNLVFPNAMPSYPDSLSSTLLAGNMPPVRESDMQYSPFPVQQSIAAKYGSNVSSISGPTISMAEVLKAASFSSTQQPNSQTNVATGPALPQHLAAAAAHPYSQHGLHLPFISYPLFAQSYAYAPPNYQQAAFSGNSTYHQNHLAAVLPQYKDGGGNSLPQSASVASGYGAALGGGGGGSAASIPGNFQMNQPPSVPPSAANLIYDDLLNAQYKDINHLMSLQQQQNDSSGSWLQGPGSRTMSALPNPYYQQAAAAAGFRQGQQPSQNYGGALGYPSFYHSQAGGISLDQQQQQQQQQQQNTRDRQLVGGGSGAGGGSQIQQAKQSHHHQQQQLWQNNY